MVTGVHLSNKMALALASLTTSFVVALALPSAGNAQVSLTFGVLPKASLKARGAGLVVRVHGSCPTLFGNAGGVSVTVAQRVSDTLVVRASSGSSIPCDGNSHRRRIAVIPSTDPFRLGSAFVKAIFVTCSEFSCPQTPASRTVTVENETIDASRFTHPNLTFTILSSGTVEADGAGAQVRVRYRCTSSIGDTASERVEFSATLAQRTSTNQVIRKNSSTEQFVCDDREEPIERVARVGLVAPRFPWREGPAFFQMSGRICDEGGECASFFKFHTVRLVAPI